MNVLTENFIKKLHAIENTHSLEGNYLVQILSIKGYGSSDTGTSRYGTIISDGTHCMHALIAKNYGTLVEKGHLVKYSIIRLTEVSMNLMANRSFEVLQNYPLTRIGNPVNIESTEASGQTTSTSLQQPNQQLQQPQYPSQLLQQSNQQLQQPQQPQYPSQLLQQPNQQLQQPQYPSQMLQQSSQQFQQSSQRLQQPIQKLQQPIQQPIKQLQRPSMQLQQPFHQTHPLLPPQRIQQQPVQQPHFMQSSGSSCRSEPSDWNPEPALFTIHCLNPYRNKWKIKARLIQKSSIKTWANARTEGKLFTINLLDKTGEIKATVFQKEVDRFYPILEEGQVYYISNARVVVAKKQFSTLNNEYELVLEHNTQIEWCADDPSIPGMNFSLTKIADMDNKEKNDTVDVIGVVHKDHGLDEIISKATGVPVKKRDLTIVDETQKEIRVSLWGIRAEVFDSSASPVVAFKGLKVSDFGGRSLSLQASGDVKMNPNIPEAHKLQSWYCDHGQHAVFSGYTNTMSTSDGAQFPENAPKLTIADAKFKYHLGEHETADYFSALGTIMYIKTESYCYAACPECSKKLTLDENLWRCEKCCMVHSAPKYRYVLSLSIQDDTSHLYVTVFDKVAEQLLEKSANEMTQLAESSGYNQLQMGAFDLPKFKIYNFKIKAVQRVYNDVSFTKYVVLQATPVDFIQESSRLVELIDSLLASTIG